MISNNNFELNVYIHLEIFYCLRLYVEMSQIKKEPNNDEKNNFESPVRYPDGTVKLRNPYIELLDQDILYHLNLNSKSQNLVEMFGDVKFVCMGGTQKRMEAFSNYFQLQMRDASCYDIIPYNFHRCSMYKVGPVLFVSHGMGTSSISIILHEIIKLMYHAKLKDPILFKIGVCGGFGLERGTVVITEDVVDGMLSSYYEVPILGEIVKRPAILNQQLVGELKALADTEDPYITISGKTMCTSDFYEEQGRLDGAFCEFTEQDRIDYLTKLHVNQRVLNVEMQAIPFAAITHHAGIKAAIVCVTFIDKLKCDQVLASEDLQIEWQVRPQKLLTHYIKRYLIMSQRLPLKRKRGSMENP